MPAQVRAEQIGPALMAAYANRGASMEWTVPASGSTVVGMRDTT
jgi:hypothetical protein